MKKRLQEHAGGIREKRTDYTDFVHFMCKQTRVARYAQLPATLPVYSIAEIDNNTVPDHEMQWGGYNYEIT